MVRCLWPLLSAVVLAGCVAPSPAFLGMRADQVSVDGMVFSVRHTAHEAEAIRVSQEALPRRATVTWRGAKAIVWASGCQVKPTSLEGDTNIVRADLDCAGAPKRLPRKKRLELDCQFTTPLRDDGFGGEVAEFECYEVR